MLNRIWFWLLFIGIVYGFGKGAYHSLKGDDSKPASIAEDRDDDATDDSLVIDKDSLAEALGSLDNKLAESVASEESDRIAVVLVPQSPPKTAPPPTLTEMGKRLNAAAISAAKVSVELCIGLIGIMALWLGLLRVADDAGLVDAMARFLRPVMRWLFPEVPDGHPAQGAMLMNIAANMLGLDNAATPMGLKAMKELQTLNKTEDTATNAMAMFLALNTSSVTLIPFTIIAYRALYDSDNPTGPLAAMVVVTSVSTMVAILVARWLSRRPKYALTHPPAADENNG